MRSLKWIKKISLKNYIIVLGLETKGLIPLSPVFPFYTPWKQKTSWFSDILNLWFFSAIERGHWPERGLNIATFLRSWGRYLQLYLKTAFLKISKNLLDGIGGCTRNLRRLKYSEKVCQFPKNFGQNGNKPKIYCNILKNVAAVR